MKISRLEAWPVTMPMAEPYTLTYQAYESAHNVFVRLVTDRRIVGHSCVAPDEFVTAETPGSVLERLQEVVEPAVRGADPLAREEIVEELRPQLHDEPAALAALDVALWDILAQKCGLPLWQLLGGRRSQIATSVTIGILSEEETVDRARHWVRQGFRILKMKAGHDVGVDVARVHQIRQAVGPEVELCVDANQAFTVEQAVWFVGETSNARLAYLEQPTPQGEPALLGEIRRQCDVPVMADESLITLDDAMAIARRELVESINVKISRVGGISEALRILSVARAAGIEAMVGCMDESALGIAAGLHLALGRSEVGRADLDGHLGLQNDPADGVVQLHNGMVYPVDRPGLGFDPSAD
jgi:L-alanine-DL-glutamate epimerase-like enolase superfamily enzyme